MHLQPVGAAWLQANFKLNRHSLSHRSFIGHNPSIELTSKGNVEQVYGTKYLPGHKPTDHLAFLLKYDDISLDFLKDVMLMISEAELVDYIESAPSSRYARKIGFIYEFLSGKELKLNKNISGNYIDLLEIDRYITASGIKNKRWRINDNLLGNRNFCPIVRKTKELNELLKENISEKIEALRVAFTPDIFRRTNDYLYKKETKSSYEIEQEKPSTNRMELFIALLMHAGNESVENMFQEKRLVQLQNAIVDQRFKAQGFRNFQNFIGQILPNYHEVLHYICPPPQFINSLMNGLQATNIKTFNAPAEIRAAILAFGFVFIHPFDDGNGRIHRFLIHDVLVNNGIVPKGTIIPVSAHMLNHRSDYDHVLESYSKPLMQIVKYDKNPNGEIIITNSEEVEGYFRYPDLTEHCIYLARTIHGTLDEDMPEELNFLQRYDEVRLEIQHIVDMPDKMLNEMILLLHQNKGELAKRKRERFKVLSDEEIQKMEIAYQKVFDIEL